MNQKNEVSIVPSLLDYLQKPGDKASACITPSGRKVVKIETDNGNSKYSATQYSTGTVVETKTKKKK